jgi:hypothetical protein
MVGQSEQELAAVIEHEIAGYRDSEERCARLMKRTAELADRWIGFATLVNISPRARVANDLFKALQVSLRLTVDCVGRIDTQGKARADLELLVLSAGELLNSCDESAIEELIQSLKHTLLISRGTT